jgi:hypothetical protein
MPRESTLGIFPISFDILFHWRRIVLGINLGKIPRIFLFQGIFPRKFLVQTELLRGGYFFRELNSSFCHIFSVSSLLLRTLFFPSTSGFLDNPQWIVKNTENALIEWLQKIQPNIFQNSKYTWFIWYKV